jgi:ABC-type uncharacterized transport system YnjBCD permease subunit
MSYAFAAIIFALMSHFIFTTRFRRFQVDASFIASFRHISCAFTPLLFFAGSQRHH